MMSTQGQASELYLTIRQLNGLLILVTFIAGGVSQIISINCPTALQEGVWGNVTCSVNKTKVAAAPSCNSSRLQFALKDESGILNPVCETPYPGTCGQAGKLNCSCVESKADIYTYQLHIMGKCKGNLICNLDCLPETSFTVSCLLGDCIKELRCSTTCEMSLIVCLPALGILVGIILSVFIWKKKIRFPRCCNQQTGEDARTKSSTPDGPVQTCGRGPTKNLPTPTSRS
ncbi:uncharacterized protein LOC112568771 [Pomacea canaliculata]|uniref:uncharacterized protein LOC112568771 n=1 Tax=Pomacea canaliculata TaxID=400727 RepID=UPI000D738A17|nr:uncharacterized protein LOC112568771 [Pomacea canaliculata]